MTLAILETGHPPAGLEARFGTYPDMFRTLLGTDVRTFRVTEGAYPERIEDHQAYLVTGSPAGVYDPLPWIDPLKTFLRQAKGRAKLVGICFGHQIMAEAFGGEVVKSDKGWGVGLHDYPVVFRADWMDAAESIAVPCSHQDQVVVQPPATQVLAASTFTPFAAFAYADQPAISFQFHPEFTPEYAKALIETRRERIAHAEAAIASLDRPNDGERLGKWIKDFLAA